MLFRSGVVNAAALPVAPAPAFDVAGDDVVQSEFVALLVSSAAFAFVEAACAVDGQHAAQQVRHKAQAHPRQVQVPLARYPAAADADAPSQRLDRYVFAAFAVFLVGQQNLFTHALALASRLQRLHQQTNRQHHHAYQQRRLALVLVHFIGT